MSKQRREPYAEDIPLSSIVEGENLSREYYGNLKALAIAIHESQWVAPLQVVKRAEGLYELKAGYRRFRAVKLLHDRGDWPDGLIPCQVFTSLSDAGGAALNVAENQHRLNPNYAELFKSCRELKERYGFSTKVIATRLNKSPQHIDNYIRCARQLHPSILKAISMSGEAASPMKLEGLFRLAGKTHTEQLKIWENATEVRETGGLDVEGGGVTPDAGKPRLRRRREIEQAIRELRQMTDKEAQFGAKVLQWALGERTEPWETS